MAQDDDRIAVENVNVPGQTTRVNAAMYAAMKEAMLRVLPTAAPGLTQAEIREAVLAHLPEELYPGGAKAGWWAKTVQLDLEAKGTVVREATKPLRWHRAQEPAGRGSSLASQYDRTAEEYDWRGPEVAFGLSFAFVNPGESVLDIGIGTGLGSALFHKAGLHVYGMDISTEMLEACRSKGFAADLQRHDLTIEPYPYGEASLDHAVCMGVLNFYRDLSVVFREVARILRDGGVFAFIVGDRGPGDAAEFRVGPEHTGSSSSVAMYRHGTDQIRGLLEGRFELVRSLEFPVPMDRARAAVLRAKAYVARRRKRS